MNQIKSERKINLKKRIEREFEDDISNLVQIGNEELIINFRNKGEVNKLDRNLETIWEKDLQAQDDEYVDCSISVSHDEKYLSLSSKNKIRIVNENGDEILEIKHKEWYSFNGSENFFTKNGKYFLNILPFENENDDLLQIRETRNFQIIEELVIPCGYSFYNFFETNISNKILIEAARGQDDCIIYILTIKKGECIIKEWEECADRIIGNCSLSKKELITAPHYGEEIISYLLDSGKENKRILENQVFSTAEEEDSDGFSYHVKFINSDNILIKSRFGRLIYFDLYREKIIGEFVPEGYKIVGYDESGEETIKEDEIEIFEGDITDYYRIDEQNLLVKHGGNKLAIYEIQK